MAHVPPAARHLAGAFLVILLAGYLGNYLHADRFSLYEDDYFFTSPPATWTFERWVERMGSALTEWPQGRPVWWLLNPTAAFVFGQFQNLVLYYAFGCVTWAVAGWAIYRFLAGSVSQFSALAAGVFFVLFPPDTSKQLLMHIVHMPVMAMFALLSVTLSIRGRAIAAFAVALVILLTYEPYYLIFCMAPLLVRDATWAAWLRRMVLHGFACASLLALVLALRRAIGDDRAEEVFGSLSQVVFRAITAPFYGVAAMLPELFERAWDALVLSDAAQYFSALLVAAGLLAFALRAKNRPAEARAPLVPRIPLWQLAAAGLAMFLAPYAYRFHDWYFPPVMTVGRLSLVHQPSAIGFAILCAAGLEGAMRLTRENRPAIWVLRGAVAGYLGLLVAFGQQVQRSEYATGWSLQVQFMRQMIEELPDLREGEGIVVLLDPEDFDSADRPPETSGFKRFSIMGFGAKRAFASAFDWPDSWVDSPAFIAYSGMPDVEKMQGGIRFLPNDFTLEFPVVRNHSFVALRWSDGKWRRHAAPITLGAREFAPRGRDPGYAVGDPALKMTPYFQSISDVPNFWEPPWPSFADDRSFPVRQAE